MLNFLPIYVIDHGMVIPHNFSTFSKYLSDRWSTFALVSLWRGEITISVLYLENLRRVKRDYESHCSNTGQDAGDYSSAHPCLLSILMDALRGTAPHIQNQNYRIFETFFFLITILNYRVAFKISSRNSRFQPPGYKMQEKKFGPDNYGYRIFSVLCGWYQR